MSAIRELLSVHCGSGIPCEFSLLKLLISSCLRLPLVLFPPEAFPPIFYQFECLLWDPSGAQKIASAAIAALSS